LRGRSRDNNRTEGPGLTRFTLEPGLFAFVGIFGNAKPRMDEWQHGNSDARIRERASEDIGATIGPGVDYEVAEKG